MLNQKPQKALEEQSKNPVSGSSLQQILTLKKCRDCSYWKEGRTYGLCTKNEPPTVLFSPFQAEICIDYTIEKPIKFEIAQPTVVKGTKGIEGRKFETYGSKDAQSETVLCDIKGKSLVVDHIDFATNSVNNSQLRVIPYKSDLTLDKELMISDYVGFTLCALIPNMLHLYNSMLFNERIYDTDNNWYRFELDRPLPFPNGVKITVKNNHASDPYNLACQVLLSIEGE